MLAKIIKHTLNDLNQMIDLPVSSIHIDYSPQFAFTEYTRDRQFHQMTSAPDFDLSDFNKAPVILQYNHSHLKPFRDNHSFKSLNIYQVDETVISIFNTLKKNFLLQKNQIQNPIEFLNQKWEEYNSTLIEANLTALSTEEQDKLKKFLLGTIQERAGVPIRKAIPFSVDVDLQWLLVDTDLALLLQMALLEHRGSHSVNIPFNITDEISIEIPYEYSFDGIDEALLIDPENKGSLQNVRISLRISGVLISPIITKFANFIQRIITHEAVANDKHSSL